MAAKLSGGDRVTKIVCKSGLALSWIFGIGTTAFGIWVQKTTPIWIAHMFYTVKTIVQEMLPLVLNLLGMSTSCARAPSDTPTASTN